MKQKPPINPKYIHVVPNVPASSSGMKKAPTIAPIKTRYLMAQNLNKEMAVKHKCMPFIFENSILPILNSSSWIFWIAHTNHNKCHEEEEEGHTKTKSVYS